MCGIVYLLCLARLHQHGTNPGQARHATEVATEVTTEVTTEVVPRVHLLRRRFVPASASWPFVFFGDGDNLLGERLILLGDFA